MMKCDNIDLKVKAIYHVLLSNNGQQAFFVSALESVDLKEGRSIRESE